MRGHLASQDKTDQGVYTDLQLMRSPAGWYIGTKFRNNEGFVEPGSRESEYFTTEEEAQHAFDTVAWTQRQNP